jgi:hypothetical protein
LLICLLKLLKGLKAMTTGNPGMYCAGILLAGFCKQRHEASHGYLEQELDQP